MVDNRHKKSKKVENKKITTTEIFLRKNSGKLPLFSRSCPVHIYLFIKLIMHRINIIVSAITLCLHRRHCIVYIKKVYMDVTNISRL